MAMQLDYDPNEAYDIIPVPEDLRGPKGWLTITYNGIPIRHYAPWARDLAERFVSHPNARREYWARQPRRHLRIVR
jgi:hypothetical protein